jgi:hypothetical protein
MASEDELDNLLQKHPKIFEIILDAFDSTLNDLIMKCL